MTFLRVLIFVPIYLFVFKEDPRKTRSNSLRTAATPDAPKPFVRSSSNEDLLNNLGPLPVSNGL